MELGKASGRHCSNAAQTVPTFTDEQIFFRTRSRDVTDQYQIMFGMFPVEHHVFLRKVRFLLRFKNSDNLICSLFLDNASSEIRLICKKYSANVNNIYTCIRRAAFGT